MRVQIEVDLDDEEVQVLKDIARTCDPVRPMGGAWGVRAEKLERYSLVKIEPLGVFMKYSLTQQGEHALLQAIR